MPGQQHSMPSNLKEAFEGLQDDVLWLHARWKVYRQLFGTSEARINLLNDFAPDFFQIVHDVLINDVFLTMSRITDPAVTFKKENLTLARLTNMIKSLGHQELTDDIEIQVRTATEQCKPFRELRNRTIAHKDLGTALNYHPDPLPGVSREMVEEALKSLRQYMDAVQTYFEGADTGYEDLGLRGDGDSIIWYLKEARAYRKHRIDGRVDPVEDGLTQSNEI
jgi:hypothetical protein